jgi:hypothetical protein
MGNCRYGMLLAVVGSQLDAVSSSHLEFCYFLFISEFGSNLIRLSALPPPGGVGAASSADGSNSSWAEMEPQIIGHFSIYPLSDIAKQIFIIKLLSPLAEYQEFLTYSHEQARIWFK